MNKSRLLRQSVVKNKNAYKTANDYYLLCYVETKNGNFVPCMLTESAIKQGIKRAEKNPEDTVEMKYGFWEKIKNVFR
jgi:hypothetical protein